jgi:hypothetical protein
MNACCGNASVIGGTAHSVMAPIAGVAVVLYL